MSEIQKAINILQDCADAARGTEFSKVYLMGSAALQDQAERGKGCELCNGDMLDRVEISKHFGEMRIALLSGGHPGEQSKFKFCPYCGRDLRKPVSK